ncbi:MAG: DNA repair protein RecN, partial [Solirubrobacteraceae bacterium]
TGAGKTVLANALDLLLGGRARAGIVRPGAAEAYVEGVFELPDALREALGERLPAEVEEIVLARRVSAEGRTRAYLGGRSAGVADLREAGVHLLAFYGQHEHRKLTLASAQLEVLDGFCEPEQEDRRREMAVAHAQVRGLAGALDELGNRAASRERELDLLRFELSEIDAAAPDPAEERELEAVRDRLRHLEALRSAAMAGAEGIAPYGEGPGAATLLAEVAGRLEATAGVDPQLDALAERSRALAIEAGELGADLRSYEGGMEGAAEDGDARLEDIEARLEALSRLKRKHGGSLAAVVEHAASCRDRIDELEHAEAHLEEATARLEAATAERAQLARAARAARIDAAPRLAAAVRDRLGALAMEGASFEVELSEREEAGPTGADAVEFVIAPNPGVPSGPLREIASGGELSRVMLAIMGAAQEIRADRGSGAAGGSGAAEVSGPTGGSGAGRASTLVFDEVDAGIGGQTARAVGDQLRGLAAARQVLCITHLPQIASLAAGHFRIAKDASTSPARTTVTELRADDLVAELVRMLGADEADLAARRHAKQLLAAA